MPSIHSVLPSRFIKYGHLDGDTTRTIGSAFVEEFTFKGKPERKIVVEFTDPVDVDGPREIMLNATNAKAIASALGTDDYDEWAGQRITLYPTKETAFGDVYDVVRVRDQAPSQHNLESDLKFEDEQDQVPF